MGVDMTERSKRAKAAKSNTDSGVAGRNIMAACSALTQMSRGAESMDFPSDKWRSKVRYLVSSVQN